MHDIASAMTLTRVRFGPPASLSVGVASSHTAKRRAASSAAATATPSRPSPGPFATRPPFREPPELEPKSSSTARAADTGARAHLAA